MSSAIRGAPVRPRIHRAARKAASRLTTRARAVEAPPKTEKSTKKSSKGYRVGVDTLNTFLFREETAGRVNGDLAIIVNNIAIACKKISNLVAVAPITGLTGLAGGSNESGDEQKKLDVEAISGDYIVCFDPIDGSSNIDAAVPTGSIFGIYSSGECVITDGDSVEDAMEKCVLNARKSGEELVCAGYVMYSSSTVMMLTCGDGVYGFTLDTATGEYVLSHDDVKIPDPGQRIYSGNNGNVDKWAPEMKAYVRYLQLGGADKDKGPFSYRYIGALVGDFHRTLLYGGIWLYPPDASAPQGKARLLYEVAPMGYLAEQAGGMAMWGETAEKRVMEVVPQNIHQRSPMFVGSTSMVKDLQEFLADRAPVYRNGPRDEL
jgi:fructose-1,6-bisphosphatase I